MKILIGITLFSLLFVGCSSETAECKLVRLNVEYFKDIRANDYDENFVQHYYDDKKELKKEMDALSIELEAKIKKENEKLVQSEMKKCPLYKEQLIEMEKLTAFYQKRAAKDTTYDVDWEHMLDETESK